MTALAFELPIVIIGAGPTGLGAAYALHGWGCDDWLLYERNDQVGGLSRSIVDEHGCTWDLGGHMLFSHYDLFTRIVEDALPASQWTTAHGDCWVRIGDGWAPHPIHRNLQYLPRGLAADCVAGLFDAAAAESGVPAANLGELYRTTYGDEINNLFDKPFNEKVWAFDPAKLQAQFVAEHVSRPNPAAAARRVLMHDGQAPDPAKRFRFPKAGGTGAIWNAIAEQLPSHRIVTGAAAVEIDVPRKTVRFSNGDERHYGTLISTAPLDRLASMSGRDDWIRQTSGLKHAALNLVGLALAGQPSDDMRSKSCTYFPDLDTPFYRVVQLSNFSPEIVGGQGAQWSLLAESAESSERPLKSKDLVGDTIGALIAHRMIKSREQVLGVWTHRAEYSQPLPTLDRDRILADLQPGLMAESILSRGRFGTWLYEVGNMDHCFMQGVEAAAHILFGCPELTIWHPELVNRPHAVLGWGRFGRGLFRRCNGEPSRDRNEEVASVSGA